MDRRDAALAGLLSAGLIAWLWPVAPIGVDVHHDGIMLKPALDLLSGQVLFRDTFTQYGALTTYLHALVLWIYPSLLSLRLAALAAYVVTLVFLYAAWRMILPRSLTALACVMFVLFMPVYEYDWRYEYWILWPWSSAFALMFQSLTVYAIFRMIQGVQAERWALLAGLACACIFWCRLPVGLLATGSVAAVWLGLQLSDWAPAGVSKRRVLGWLLGGFVLIHGLMLGNIVRHGAAGQWWYQNLVWPFRWSGTVPLTWQQAVTVYTRPAAAGWLVLLLLALALPFLARRSGLTRPAGWLVAYYVALAGAVAWHREFIFPQLMLRSGGWSALLPAMVIAQALISLWLVRRQRHPRTNEFWQVSALVFLCLGALPQYYPLPDPWHVLWSLAPAFGLGLYLGWRWLAWPAPVCALVLLACCLPAIYAKGQSAAHALSLPRVTLTKPLILRGMKVTAEKAASLRQITETLDTIERHAPNLPSVLIGSDALFLCFPANRTNVTPYYVSWHELADEPIQQVRWSYIQRVRPLVFFARARWDLVNKFYRDDHYVPLVYVPGEALEIAVPQELADAMGLGVYGAAKKE
jgi:hypothetical protein